MNVNLFGEPIVEKNDLKSEFIISPFSILDTASGDWLNRKNIWKSLGIKSEVGRSMDGEVIRMKADKSKTYKTRNRLDYWSKDEYLGDDNYVSIFDPVLCEIMYKWFIPKNGSILDPFAGGSVRGIVAHHLDYEYVGIDLCRGQIEANKIQAQEIFGDGEDIPLYHHPRWIYGDSNEKLGDINQEFDFIFSCPPYYDLEIYSDNPRDISSLSKLQFDIIYEQIIKQCCDKLKNNRFACFVVGNCRDQKTGYIKDLVGTTIRAFEKCGVMYYNEMILKNVSGSAPMRARTNMTYIKVIKTNQNVIVFCKGDPKKVFDYE